MKLRWPVSLTSRHRLLRKRFSEVFLNNEWGDEESASGPGSRRDSGSVGDALAALEMGVRDYDVRSINDIPCGDFNWMPLFLQKNAVIYRGFDIVPELVAKNKRIYPQFQFSCLDITSSIPPYADLVFCKDLVNHLSRLDVAKLLRNVKLSGARYLLATNNPGHENVDLSELHGGLSRHLDLMAPPYSMPAPVWANHYLAMWDLQAIRLEFFDDLIRLAKRSQ